MVFVATYALTHDVTILVLLISVSIISTPIHIHGIQIMSIHYFSIHYYNDWSSLNYMYGVVNISYHQVSFFCLSLSPSLYLSLFLSIHRSFYLSHSLLQDAQLIAHLEFEPGIYTNHQMKVTPYITKTHVTTIFLARNDILNSFVRPSRRPS